MLERQLSHIYNTTCPSLLSHPPLCFALAEAMHGENARTRGSWLVLREGGE